MESMRSMRMLHAECTLHPLRGQFGTFLQDDAAVRACIQILIFWNRYHHAVTLGAHLMCGVAVQVVHRAQ